MSILGTLGTHVVKWYKRPNGNMLINHLSPYIIKVVQYNTIYYNTIYYYDTI